MRSVLGTGPGWVVESLNFDNVSIRILGEEVGDVEARIKFRRSSHGDTVVYKALMPLLKLGVDESHDDTLCLDGTRTRTHPNER